MMSIKSITSTHTPFSFFLLKRNKLKNDDKFGEKSMNSGMKRKMRSWIWEAEMRDV